MVEGKYVFGYEEALLESKQVKLRKIELSSLPTVSLCEGHAPPAMFQNLRSLSITYCNLLQGSLFTSDGAQCLSQLNCLELHKCKRLERIVEASNKKIILPKLKKLTLEELPMFYESSTFDIECPSLEHLKLSSLPTVSLGHAPPAMFQNLQSLSIRDCKLLEGSLFTYDVALCLSQLNFLELLRCPLLERIVEASNKKVILPKLKKLTLLEVPKLYYGSATFDIVCPSLEKLSLRGCPPLQHKEVRKIDLFDLATVSICNGPSRLPPAVFQNLQSLSIEWCKLEGSLFTYDVAQCLSQLSSLKLKNCPQLKRIVEASNKKIILPELKQLSLWYLPMLYYESATFDIVCPSLEELHLWDCAKFSASSSDFQSRKQVRLGWWR
ncbi:hypothetical protein ACLB2K_070820 [Fragaria x ananassa]